MAFDFRISALHPAFAGHFPGRPVVPAALLIDQVSREIEQRTGEKFCGVKKVRFPAPIEPDQLINVDYREVDAGEYRFECRVAEKVVAKGLLSTAAGRINFLLTATLERQPRIDAAVIYQKLPHRGSICLLEFIEQVDKEHIRCVAKPVANNPLARDGELPVWASLEYAAQAFACHGLINSATGESGGVIKEAWVVGIKHLYCSRHSFPVTDELPTIAASLIANQPGAASYRFSLTCGLECVSSGQVNVAFGVG